ncbi:MULTISPECIES: hypothetical protein [Parafrankia]|uniref:Uncharacterized protein n=1 Tax=Parafrankia soli TaxID=2599596 RepID=A0A1S1QZS8_9ACTN|nr:MULTISPECIES: hypothetical protein [Parafrankia]OHV38572.1 hypothetical protein BBK14_14105 [Parafrankia soli]TCJ33190.1 hypothetical protein E0504_38690 [Parafrankia sp. BMG5.11]
MVALLVLISGCGASSYDYVTNKDDGAFLKVPAAWTYQEMPGPALFGIDARNVSPEMLRGLMSREWVVGLDAAEKFDETSLFVPDAPLPKGFVQVRHLLPEEANAVSTNDLRNFVVTVDDAVAAQEEAVRQDPYGARLAPSFLLLADEKVAQDSGVHGVHLIYQVATAAGLVTIDQTSLLDQNQTVLYQLVLACSALCYTQHGGQIGEVTGSFTIKPTDRGQ